LDAKERLGVAVSAMARAGKNVAPVSDHEYSIHNSTIEGMVLVPGLFAYTKT
jgi:hypothetical protein